MPPIVKTDMISLFSRLRPNQFTTVYSYPFIPNIRIIGVILPARKNSKIAITRSCHLVLVQSANIYVYSIRIYPYRLYEFLRTGRMELRTLICIYDPDTEFILAILYSLWRKIYAVAFSAVIFSLQFPFHSNHPLHYQFISSTVNISVILLFNYGIILQCHSALKLRNYTPVLSLPYTRLIPYRYTTIRG